MVELYYAICESAVAMRLLGIGEAVKGLSTETTSSEPEIKWRQIGRLRDVLGE